MALSVTEPVLPPRLLSDEGRKLLAQGQAEVGEGGEGAGADDSVAGALAKAAASGGVAEQRAEGVLAVRRARDALRAEEAAEDEDDEDFDIDKFFKFKEKPKWSAGRAVVRVRSLLSDHPCST